MPSTASERLLIKRMIVVTLSIVLLCCVAIWAVWAQHQNVEKTRLALQQSYRVQVQLQNVFSLIQDAETSQRGYILTGDPAFLTPYNDAAPAIGRSLGRLQALLRDDPDLLQKVIALEQLIQAKRTEMARTIQIRDTQGGAAAAAAVQGGIGKKLMDQIRDSIASLRGAEERARTDRRALEEREFRQLVALFLSLIAIIAVVLIISSFVSFNALKHRMASEAALRTQRRQALGLQHIAQATAEAHSLQEALSSTLVALLRLLKAQDGVALWQMSASGQTTVRQMTLSPTADGTIAQTVEEEIPLPNEQWDQLLSTRDPSIWIDTAYTGANGQSTQRIHIPVFDETGPTALLVLTTPHNPPEIAEPLATAATTQLRHAAERQRIMDTLSDSLARNQGIFDSAIDGILTIRTNGTIESINPAALRMFGYTDVIALPAHVTRLIVSELPDPVAVDTEPPIQEGIGRVHESVGQRQDGSHFPIDVGLNELTLFNKKLFVAVVRDATERKRLEQIKNEFISTVSHELRTPLTSISGALRLLESGAAGELPEKAARLATIAHANSNRLVRLVNDILDIQKIEAGLIHFDIQPQSLEAVVRLAIDANQEYAGRYGVTLELRAPDSPLTVLADTDRLNQVITNLLSNAVKFSPEGGTVTVELSDQHDCALISVIDHGPGIPPEFQERIYHRFAQADASDQRSKGGTGLGLSITKQLVTQMNGRISFTSSPSGTVFAVEIPLATPGAPNMPSSIQSADRP